jgi:DNA-binding TFAR19-related protein (PDSD5 family)
VGMAETLESLIDKLTINDLRHYHLGEMIRSSARSGFRQRQKKIRDFSIPDLKKRLKLVQLQKRDLIQEIEDFIVAAVKGKVKIRDEN